MKMHDYYYCLVYNGNTNRGKLVGLDKDSGGYPFPAFHPSQVQYWPPSEAHKAIEYAKIVKSFGPFRLVKVTLTKESVL